MLGVGGLVGSSPDSCLRPAKDKDVRRKEQRNLRVLRRPLNQHDDRGSAVVQLFRHVMIKAHDFNDKLIIFCF